MEVNGESSALQTHVIKGQEPGNLGAPRSGPLASQFTVHIVQRLVAFDIELLPESQDEIKYDVVESSRSSFPARYLQCPPAVACLQSFLRDGVGLQETARSGLVSLLSHDKALTLA